MPLTHLAEIDSGPTSCCQICVLPVFFPSPFAENTLSLQCTVTITSLVICNPSCLVGHQPAVENPKMMMEVRKVSRRKEDVRICSLRQTRTRGRDKPFPS